MPRRYLDLLEPNEAVIAKNVTENLYTRHIPPAFLPRFSSSSELSGAVQGGVLLMGKADSLVGLRLIVAGEPLWAAQFPADSSMEIE